MKQRAVVHLARREHSREELAGKLASYAESETDIETVLNELVAKGLLSDHRFAEVRVNVRAKKYGSMKIAYELRSKGVAPEIINAVLGNAGDELSRAREIWRRKFGVTPADAKSRAQQMRFLLSRGFTGEVVSKVLGGKDE